MRSKIKNKVLWIAGLAVIALLAIVLTVITQVKSKAEINSDAGGDIVIPITNITDKATFYRTTVNGIKMEVFAVKAPDGSIRTAFNTCQVCYSSGRGYYKQEGSELVCQNCGNRFKTTDVEVIRGGCNPVPITSELKTQTETTITIPMEFLQEASVIFTNWKQ